MLRAAPYADSDTAHPPKRRGDDRRSGMAGLLMLAVVALATGFIACLIARLVSPPAPATLLIWPGSAIALAFAWRFGPFWAAPGAAGAALWVFAEAGDPLLAFLAFAGSAVGPLVAMRLMHRLRDWRPNDYRLDASVRFALLVVLVAAPIDALLLAIGLPATTAAADIDPLRGFFIWWLIDALGLLLVVPAMLVWVGKDGPRGRSSRAGALLDTSALLAALLVLVLALALDLLGLDAWARSVLFLYFPVVAWTAIRCEERASALSLLVVGLPLLAVRSWQVEPEQSLQALDASVLLACTMIVALMLQATAADRRRALLKLSRQAREDMLTGLLNDRGLITELGERLAVSDRPDYGLIGLHLANFDTLADLCGATPAAHLEESVAGLLRRQAATCLAARLSAGRFALLIEADSVSSVRSVARELYAQLNGQVFRTEHGSVRLQMCVGGLFVEGSTEIDGENSLAALGDTLAIAASVRDPQLFVEPLSQTMIDARRSHLLRLELVREAIREQRFELHAQPIADPDAPTGMLSYEVLLRLVDREGKLIRPPDFLSIAAQAQITPAMDRGVIQSVFGWLATNPEALARTWKCSINLSGLTMSDGTSAEFIREQRAAFGIPAERIVFEITESEAIRNPAAASRLVDELKAQGFGIALDDFGTGLATFEYLKRFPLDYLKIDGSFVRNLVNSPIDEEIVLSTLRVAQRLNIRTVAEHVHNQDVRDRLTGMGVEYLQGELIGKALPLDRLFS